MKIEEIIQQKKFKSEQERAMINFFYTSNFITLKQTQFFKKFDISAQQYNILRILKGQYPKAATVNLLIERMLDKSSNASRLVEKLRSKYLLSRVQCPEDRRSVNVVITEKGIELLDAISKDQKNEVRGMNLLSDKEAKQFNELLDKIRRGEESSLEN
jgi:DNA-binding MarR family transcriptional regulator